MLGLLKNSRFDGEWRSLVARVVRDDEAGGSNPLSPTNFSLTSKATLIYSGINDLLALQEEKFWLHSY